MPETARPGLQSSWTKRLELLTTVVLLVAAIVVLFQSLGRRSASANLNPEPGLPTDVQAIDGAQTMGTRDAPLGLIVYSDFECPFCLRFSTEVLPRLAEAYVQPGKLLIAFRHMPLSIHPNAMAAAQAAECAGEQGRFWPYHDVLFGAKPPLNASRLTDAVRSVGADLSQWNDCMTRGPSDVIVQSMATASALGISGTPFLLLGMNDQAGITARHAINGYRPTEHFAVLIDDLLTSGDPQ